MFDQHYKKENPTFTGITRGVGGFGFGADGGGGGGGFVDKDINLLIKGKFGANGAPQTGASVATYWASAVQNYYGGQKTNEYVESDFTRVGDGILKFTLGAGVYRISARSADGSGSEHWTGAYYQCDLTLTSTLGMLLLIPNHGLGSYSAGGGLFLIAGTDYTSSSNRAILIIGGGGGGYSSRNYSGQPGSMYNFLSGRRGPNSGTNGDYDGGAGWLNSYNTEVYGGIGGSYDYGRAKHFVQGGRGGISQACSSSQYGGFGGGGGSCPAGAGGHVGGYPGTNSGGAFGGGGGTSYYNTSYSPAIISNMLSIDTGSYSSSSASGETESMQGFFGIYTK